MSKNELLPQVGITTPWNPVDDFYDFGEASLPPEIDLSTATRRSLREQEVIYRAGEVAVDIAQESGSDIANYRAIKDALTERRRLMPQRKSTGRVIVDSLRHRFTS
jgi:hypothetical protein